jgi:hypothetical protein
VSRLDVGELVYPATGGRIPKGRTYTINSLGDIIPDWLKDYIIVLIKSNYSCQRRFSENGPVAVLGTKVGAETNLVASPLRILEKLVQESQITDFDGAYYYIGPIITGCRLNFTCSF